MAAESIHRSLPTPGAATEKSYPTNRAKFLGRSPLDRGVSFMTQKRSPFDGMSEDQNRRFVGGRTAYHHRRRVERDQRRARLARMLPDLDISQRGWRKEAAEALGVSRWTVRADLVALAAIARETRTERAYGRTALQDTYQRLLDCWVGDDGSDEA